MAYQLQPGMNYTSARPNTMLYGTAPYMAGKGSPAQYIETSDALRPQSTSQFNKVLAKTYEQNLHPLQNVACKVPLRTRTYEPSSTRAELQNGLFQQRYLNKNVNKK
jgi:hypothetical protein